MPIQCKHVEKKKTQREHGSVRSDQRQCASAMFGQHLICLINVYAADTLISSSNLDYSVHIILPLLTATRKSVFAKNQLFIKPNSLSWSAARRQNTPLVSTQIKSVFRKKTKHCTFGQWCNAAWHGWLQIKSYCRQLLFTFAVCPKCDLRFGLNDRGLLAASQAV